MTFTRPPSVLTADDATLTTTRSSSMRFRALSPSTVTVGGFTDPAGPGEEGLPNRRVTHVVEFTGGR